MQQRFAVIICGRFHLTQIRRIRRRFNYRVAAMKEKFLLHACQESHSLMFAYLVATSVPSAVSQQERTRFALAGSWQRRHRVDHGGSEANQPPGQAWARPDLRFRSAMREPQVARLRGRPGRYVFERSVGQQPACQGGSGKSGAPAFHSCGSWWSRLTRQSKTSKTFVARPVACTFGTIGHREATMKEKAAGLNPDKDVNHVNMDILEIQKLVEVRWA